MRDGHMQAKFRCRCYLRRSRGSRLPVHEHQTALNRAGHLAAAHAHAGTRNGVKAKGCFHGAYLEYRHNVCERQAVCEGTKTTGDLSEDERRAKDKMRQGQTGKTGYERLQRRFVECGRRARERRAGFRGGGAKESRALRAASTENG